jgi:hypothetical protein
MSTTLLRPSERTRPFVAVVCVVPLPGEAMRSALEFADVQTFAARGGDLNAAEQAIAYARENNLPVLHVSRARAAPAARRHVGEHRRRHRSGAAGDPQRRRRRGLRARSSAGMIASGRTAILDGLGVHEEQRGSVDDRTLEILEHCEKVGRSHRRGWLVRRALFVADMVGLTAAFVAAEQVFGGGISRSGHLAAPGEYADRHQLDTHALGAARINRREHDVSLHRNAACEVRTADASPNARAPKPAPLGERR